MSIRRTAQTQIRELARWNPCLLITGPRQAGKTTLARLCFPKKAYVSLEDPDVRESAVSDPRGFLDFYPNGAVLDEVQHAPDLLSYLQTSIDRQRQTGTSGVLWVLTGSQQFGLYSRVSQSLAGRVGIVQLLPFSLWELQKARHIWSQQPIEELLWSGLYPVPVDQGNPPHAWYADYFSTYVERDLRQMVNVRDLSSFRIFIRMCAARTAQAVNLSALASDCGISVNTAKGWLSILEASYIVFRLPQHHANFGKRLVKSPKLYFYDTGLASWLVGLRSPTELSLSSMRGALFETWLVSEAQKALLHNRSSIRAHYWRDQSGVEIDLLLDLGSKLIPLECKAGKTVASDWFSPLLKYIGMAGDQVVRPTLVYGGSIGHKRHSVDVIGWRQFPRWMQQRAVTGE